jgi:methylmalonyl-CoA epimerase
MASLNHIGIAVANLPQLKKLFSILNLEVRHTETVAEQGVVTHFLPLPLVQGHLELLEPLSSDGTIAQFLQNKGPGIHHLSFLVEKGQLEPLCDQLKSEGFKLIYEKPKNGAHQMKVNFLHPSSCGGMLIEVMEPQ